MQGNDLDTPTTFHLTIEDKMTLSRIALILANPGRTRLFPSSVGIRSNEQTLRLTLSPRHSGLVLAFRTLTFSDLHCKASRIARLTGGLA